MVGQLGREELLVAVGGGWGVSCWWGDITYAEFFFRGAAHGGGPAVHPVPPPARSTNLAYNLKNNTLFALPFGSRVPLDLAEPHQRASLLGVQFDYSSRKEFRTAFESIFWFSYRRNGQQTSDVGWGCMIRVVQMLLA